MKRSILRVASSSSAISTCIYHLPSRDRSVRTRPRPVAIVGAGPGPGGLKRGTMSSQFAVMVGTAHSRAAKAARDSRRRPARCPGGPSWDPGPARRRSDYRLLDFDESDEADDDQRAGWFVVTGLLTVLPPPSEFMVPVPKHSSMPSCRSTGAV